MLTPFNIELLIPTPEQLKYLGQVTSHEIFEGTGGNFHDEGLFSTEIFGRVGSESRESLFGYIHLGLDILHPVIYRNLLRLKLFYEEIILGKSFALFDPIEKDFVRSNEIEGKTGYDFFIQNWLKIEFKATDSPIRKVRIDLINKYKNNCYLRDMVVIPAAYRDVEIDDGRVTMDEINDRYRYLLSQSTGVPDFFGPGADLSIYDRKRVSMQLTVLAIYNHYEKLLSGKKGFIQAKWASRRIFNGTRNVISSVNTSSPDLTKPNKPRFKDVVVGLYQTAVGVKPLTIHSLRTGVVGEIFETSSNRVRLVDPETLKAKWVEVSNLDMDTWGSPEGLERVINELKIIPKRHRPIVISDHYLALIYMSPDGGFKILRSIEDLPDDRDPNHVRPISYAELIYLSGLRNWPRLVGFVTRYPIENYNSSIPISTYVKTTSVGELRYQINDDWEIDKTLPTALEFPVFDPKAPTVIWYDSVGLSSSVLGSLGADPTLVPLSREIQMILF